MVRSPGTRRCPCWVVGCDLARVGHSERGGDTGSPIRGWLRVLGKGSIIGYNDFDAWIRPWDRTDRAI